MATLERVPAASGGSYSDAVVIEGAGLRWIHIAGQTPRLPAAPDLAGQSDQVFDQLEEILAGVGADLTNLVQITVYLTDLTAYARFAEVRTRRLGDHLPVSAAVGVATLLDGALVEISAAAVSRARP